MQIAHEQRLNPEIIRVLSWNIKKQSRPQLNVDLAGYSRDIDLALLQEVHMEGRGLNHFNGDWHRNFAPGFSLPKRTTGVMTLSTSEFIHHDKFSHTEPLFRTNKAASLTCYPLRGVNETLLVINLHAVNFSIGIQTYNKQLLDLLEHVDAHVGPVIFAGDFNAWHQQRTLLLAEISSHRGLREVTFDEDKRMRVFGRYLDYMFVRDLQVLDARTLHSEGSDHNPLLATLAL